MVNILITGADGQLGSEIRKLAFLYKEFNFIYTDISSLDITNLNNLDSFFSNKGIQYIINCAAYTNVDKAETEKEKAHSINVLAVKNLAQISSKYNSKIIHISTDYVFDSSSQNFPFKETDMPVAESAYGYSKLLGEKELINYKNSIIIRTSWLYSNFGHNIFKTIVRLARERKELNFVFDQIGTPTYAGDLASAIVKVIEHSESNNTFLSGIYHFSNEGVCSWYDFAMVVVKMLKFDCRVMPIETKDYPLPAKRPYYSVLNKSKIRESFGIKIPHWSDGLERCINQYLEDKV
jgi:dTDP-4-dehydrorhamnose reductase